MLKGSTGTSWRNTETWRCDAVESPVDPTRPMAVAGPHLFSCAHTQPVAMHVTGKDPVPVIDHDKIPLVIHRLRDGDRSAGHGKKRLARLSPQIDAPVHIQLVLVPDLLSFHLSVAHDHSFRIKRRSHVMIIAGMGQRAVQLVRTGAAESLFLFPDALVDEPRLFRRREVIDV